MNDVEIPSTWSQVATDIMVSKYFRKAGVPQTDENGNELIYLCGNSLGLQPKRTKAYLNQELEDWAKLGVEGHEHAKNPWMPYHEFLSESYSKIVGGKKSEVVAMNSLTVNLHLMMVSFYRPNANRNKILIGGRRTHEALVPTNLRT